jgi:hypothetical protein
MRASRALLPVLFSLGLAAWASVADAACYANFAGNCSRSGSGPAYCAFDGTRTYNNTSYSVDLTQTHCGSSSVGMVFWEFERENPSGASTWDDLYVPYTYTNPAAIDNDAIIRMTLYCADGCTAVKERYLLFVVVGPGDMYCNKGWN